VTAGRAGGQGQLWLELPPIAARAPARLLVFLHGAASSPEAFAPVAVAWQLKFPGATAALLQGAQALARGARWFDPADRDERGAPRLAAAVAAAAARIAALQRSLGLPAERTVLVGFEQGATVALELARAHPTVASIVVAYSARLASPLRTGERIEPTVHLIHGALDSVVPLVHATRALRGLEAVGARATLDVLDDGAHGIDQDSVNVGTARVMATVFRGRAPGIRPTVH
jgi:phospholipase/carboxylesterase